MRVGLYFDSRHLGSWSWRAFLDGELPLAGTDSQNLRLGYQLAKRGYEVFLFTTQLGGRAPIERLMSIHVDGLKRAVLYAKGADLDVLIFVDRGKRETLEGVTQCEIVRMPCIVWAHNGPWAPVTDWLARAETVRRVVCVSATQADYLRDHPVFEKTEFIYNGIDPEFFRVGNTTKRYPHRVCFLGSLTPTKGFQYVARAWPIVRQTFPEASLIVLGSSRLYDRNAKVGPLGIADPEFEQSAIIPYLGSTIEQAKENGVIFLGLVPPKTIREVVTSCSVGVVNPSCRRGGSFETFCLSAVEVQAGGAAVVGGNRGGLRESVKNGETGVLINSEEELANVLIELLSEPHRTASMGVNGAKWVRESFAWDMIVERWCTLLQDVRDGKRPSPPSFSLNRASVTTVARECIRQARRIPFLRDRMPTLNELKALWHVT